MSTRTHDRYSFTIERDEPTELKTYRYHDGAVSILVDDTVRMAFPDRATAETFAHGLLHAVQDADENYTDRDAYKAEGGCTIFAPVLLGIVEDES